MKVKVSDLAEEISFMLDEYSEEVRWSLQYPIAQIADRCLDRIRKASPRNTGEYSKGWTRKGIKSKNKAWGPVLGYVIYNKNKPMLAHLLEFGHAKINGGRTQAIPHIFPAVKKAEEELVAAIAETLENL